jgi:hypothetical protein
MKNIALLAAVLLTLTFGISRADPEIKPFTSTSYAQILQQHAQRGFVISVWSVDCPSCLKDMAVLKSLHNQYPKLPIVLISTDEADAAAEVRAILQRNQLQDVENWQFGNEDAQQLRYQIDPKWYGELPRSYAFNPRQQRQGKSGAMDLAGFETWLKDSGAI